MRKLFTFLLALATSVGLSWATTNSITINESSHGSVVASSSSAAAGETITLTATPDDGYQLKSISGVYLPVPETLNSVIAQTTVTGTNFQCVGTMNANAYGWRVYNPGTAQTLTVSSLNGTTLIKKIEFTATMGPSRTNDMLSVSAGTLSFDGNTPSTTVTINDINATSVTISGSGTNSAKTWYINSVRVYTDEVELEISDTENANVKTFIMVDSEVKISAEFEPEPEPAKYYIVGSMTSWGVDENYEMNPMLDAETEEYFYTLDLTTTSEFKVVKVEGENQTWYPEGMGNNYGQNGEITEDGEYTVHFRPNFDGGEDWFYNCIYAKKTGEFVPEEATYYIVGDMTGWDVNEAYEMTPNNGAETEEYLYVLDLTTTNQFKVVKVQNGQQSWFPSGMGNNYGENGEITEDGEYTVYFRPNNDGGEDWFYNCIYVSKNEPEPTAVENVQTNEVQATKFFRDGMLLIVRDGRTYTVTGQAVK